MAFAATACEPALDGMADGGVLDRGSSDETCRLPCGVEWYRADGGLIHREVIRFSHRCAHETKERYLEGSDAVVSTTDTWRNGLGQTLTRKIDFQNDGFFDECALFLYRGDGCLDRVDHSDCPPTSVERQGVCKRCAAGRCTELEEFRDDGASTLFSYSFDAQGKLVYEVGTNSGADGSSYYQHYFYDDGGRLIRSDVRLAEGGEITATASYRYCQD